MPNDRRSTAARLLRTSFAVLLVTGGALGAGRAAAQPSDPAKVEVKTEKLAEGVYMLRGAGGNVGLFTGAEGAFLIDDDYPAITPKVLAAVKGISKAPLRFVVNTHWHDDHTGGNEQLGTAGALIVAHENVRKRMGTEQFIAAFGKRVPPAPAKALPIVTFTESVTFHINGDDVDVVHVPPAHTDGDAVVHFRKANVVHTGDLLFNGIYPFIDVSSGGSVEGMIAAADRVLSLADEKTRIIPGHGPLGDRAALSEFRAMLVAVRDRVRDGIGQKKSLAEITASKPTSDFDEKWGKGFLSGDQFVGLVYASLTAQP